MAALPFTGKAGLTLSFGVALVFLVSLLVPAGGGSLIAIMGILFLLYAVLFLTIMPMMFWFLLPHNIKKPLSDSWKLMGFLLLVIGYIPGCLWLHYLLSLQSFDVADLFLIPVFLGPLFVFITSKIKKSYSTITLKGREVTL